MSDNESSSQPHETESSGDDREYVPERKKIKMPFVKQMGLRNRTVVTEALKDDEDEGPRPRSSSRKRKTKSPRKRKAEYDITEEVKEARQHEFEGKLLDSKSENLVEALEKIPKNKKLLLKLQERINEKISVYRRKFLEEQREMEHRKSTVDEDAIPVCADVRTFDFQNLAKTQLKNAGQLFDVIMIDPPWQLSTSQPSRGVAIAYDSLSDDFIAKIPLPKLSTDGFLFVWTINAKYAFACKLIHHWGYKLVDEITWTKKTINGKIAKGHGFYLQHAKESCLIGVKGKVEQKLGESIGPDVIFSERRGQSQKPEEIYKLIEELVPNGFYLEIFGRRNNVRKRWVTVGNEL